MADSDKKAARALARMIAKAKKEAPVDPMICACDCTACSADPQDCEDCVNADCEDENCEDCPNQDEEEDAKAKAAVRRTLRGVAIPDSPEAVPTKTTECGCTCKPCLDGDCKGCVNQDCRDDNCVDCPMPKVRNEKNEKDKQARWMVRVGGELEQTAALYATGSDILTRRHQTAHELLHAGILPRLQAAEKLLTRLKAVRDGEVSSLGKWSERVSGELRQAAALPVALVAEIGRQSGADSESAQQIEATEKLLGRLKQERAAELEALASWTERVNAELLESGTLQASALEAITRHAQQNGALAQKIEAAETLLARLTGERASELAAIAKWTERLSAELNQVGVLEASAMEAQGKLEIAASGKIDAAETTLAGLRSQYEGMAALPLERLSAELKQAGDLQASAIVAEAARRSRLEANAQAKAQEIDEAAKTLAELKTERAAELTAALQWTKRVKAELDKSVAQNAAIVKVIRQREHAAEQVARNAQTHWENARTALLPAGLLQILEAESKTRNEEAAALLAWGKETQQGLQESLELQASAAEELVHRSRVAEGLLAKGDRIAEVETLLSELKAERAAELTAAAGGELEESAKLCSSVADELGRRARLMEPAEKRAQQFELVEQTLAEVKAECAAAVTVRTRISGELQEAGKLRASVEGELARRSRLIATVEPGNASGVDVGALADAGALLAQLKAERAAEVTAVAEFATRVTAALESSAKLQASAAEEIGRRHRIAESAEENPGEIDAAQKMLTAIKTQRAAAVKAIAELVDRVTHDLEEAAKAHGSAADDLARRARLAESSGEIGQRLEETETLVTELKKCVAGEMATEALCLQASADLKKAGEMCRSAVEEIARRGRLLTL